MDYLIIDFPPGTGDEPRSAAQLIPNCDGAVIVTTSKDLSVNNVKKCINFSRQVNVPVLGVIENMSGLVRPHFQSVIDIFKKGEGAVIAKEKERALSNASASTRVPSWLNWKICRRITHTVHYWRH